MLINKDVKTSIIARALLSLLLFILFNGIASFYLGTISLDSVSVYFCISALISTIFLFPFKKSLGLKLLFFAFSVNLFGLFLTAVIIYSENLNLIVPLVVLYTVSTSFLLVKSKIGFLIPIIISLIVVFGTDAYYKSHTKTNLKNLMNYRPLKSTFENKTSEIQILEFWYSSCSVCKENFGEFEEFYVENKDNYDIRSVNIEIERDYNTGFDPIKYVDDKGYNFPIEKITRKIAENYYDVTSTPTTIIIRNDTMIFKENIIPTSELITKVLERSIQMSKKK